MAPRKYHFDTRFFQNIDSPEKAYWLGFIAADGNVGEYSLELGLSTKDRKHLCTFAEHLKYDGPIVEREYKGYQSSRVILCSIDMVRDLYGLGITARKSLTLVPWKGPPEAMAHYWRGVFDGDGSFSMCIKSRTETERYEAWKARLVGTRLICSAFASYIGMFNLPYSRDKLPHKHSSVWEVEWEGWRPAQAVAKVLYEENNQVCLERKKNLADQLLKRKASPLIIVDKFEKEYLLGLYEEIGNWSMVAKQLGVSHNGLYKHIRKLNLPRKNTGPRPKH